MTRWEDFRAGYRPNGCYWRSKARSLGCAIPGRTDESGGSTGHPRLLEVEGQVVGSIDGGLLVLLGVAKGDGDADCRFMVEKLRGLRIFADEAGKMNRSLLDAGGSILLVSQFTLLGSTKSGRRPGFEDAAPPDEARRWYERVSEELKMQGTAVETGVFAAHMKVELVNDGPVTFLLDSRSGF